MLGFDPLSVAPLSGLGSELVETTSSVILVGEVEPTVFPDVGGEFFTIRGTFASGLAHEVQLLGPVNAPVAHKCYASKRGQSYTPKPRNAETLLVATPTLPFGTYDVRVVQGANEGTLPHAVNIVPRVWEQRTFDLRALHAPLTAAGVRKLERQPFLIPPGSIVITPTANGSGNVGVPFSQPVVITNTLPYRITWSALGALPPGLSIDGVTGTISGTPTSTGAFAGIKRRATWALGTLDSNTFTITISP